MPSQIELVKQETTLKEGGEKGQSQYVSPELQEAAVQAAKKAHNPVKMTFENIEYEVEVSLSKEEAQKQGKSTSRHRIIKNVSGYAMPGQTLFIMGASGAGKTSLLNILSDRISLKRNDTLSGKRIMNDTIECT